MATALRLHVIGSGCPVPHPAHFGSAFVLEVGNDYLLVDCGPATTYKLARVGVPPERIDHVFLTHLHFDHTVDLACLALCRWDLGCGDQPPLHVYGPEPTAAFVDRLLGAEGAFAPDWRSRVTHPASHACYTARGGVMPRPKPEFVVCEVREGNVAGNERWQATAVPVRHVEPTLVSLAYRFETTAGSVVFAGDCADCQSLRDLASGADTLVLACTHFGSQRTPAAVRDVITGTDTVAAIANEAGVPRVVLSHVSPNFSKPGLKERAVAEIARSYDGEILFPGELTTIELAG